MRSLPRFLAAFVLCAGLTACASTSAYAPQARVGEAGYSEQRVDDMHWRVEFVGDESTSAAIVERNLLFRAAQLTQASGYDWFLPSAHSASVDDEIVVDALRQTEGSRPNARWRPYWRRRGALGWSDWRPRGPLSVEERTPPRPTIWSFVRYSARETIEMGRGDKPLNAFDAAGVTSLFTPTLHPSH